MKKKIKIRHGRDAYNGFYVQKYHPVKNPPSISERVISFLDHWYSRVDSRGWGSTEFRRMGLCQALVKYITDYSLDEENALKLDDYVNELRDMFVEDGLDRAFPFNDGIEGFLKEEDAMKNKERVKWVRDRIIRYNQEMGIKQR